MIDTWTEERTERLRTLYATGLSCSLIAAELGGDITRNAVIGKVHRANLPRRGKGGNYSVKGLTVKKRAPPTVQKARQRYSPESKRVMTIFQSAEMIKLRCVEIVPLNLTLMELDSTTQCHYIPGDDLLYCGHPLQAGSSYCAPHHALSRSEPRNFSPEERQRRRMHFIKMNAQVFA